ncbi:hypothetical protein E4U24_008406, partial [Claviceps purpurea]
MRKLPLWSKKGSKNMFSYLLQAHHPASIPNISLSMSRPSVLGHDSRESRHVHILYNH